MAEVAPPAKPKSKKAAPPSRPREGVRKIIEGLEQIGSAPGIEELDAEVDRIVGESGG